MAELTLPPFLCSEMRLLSLITSVLSAHALLFNELAVRGEVSVKWKQDLLLTKIGFKCELVCNGHRVYVNKGAKFFSLILGKQ